MCHLSAFEIRALSSFLSYTRKFNFPTEQVVYQLTVRKVAFCQVVRVVVQRFGEADGGEVRVPEFGFH